MQENMQNVLRREEESQIHYIKLDFESETYIHSRKVKKSCCENVESDSGLLVQT